MALNLDRATQASSLTRGSSADSPGSVSRAARSPAPLESVGRSGVCRTTTQSARASYPVVGRTVGPSAGCEGRWQPCDHAGLGCSSRTPTPSCLRRSIRRVIEADNGRNERKRPGPDRQSCSIRTGRKLVAARAAVAASEPACSQLPRSARPCANQALERRDCHSVDELEHFVQLQSLGRAELASFVSLDEIIDLLLDEARQRRHERPLPWDFPPNGAAFCKELRSHRLPLPPFTSAPGKDMTRGSRCPAIKCGPSNRPNWRSESNGLARRRGVRPSRAFILVEVTSIESGAARWHCRV